MESIAIITLKDKLKDIDKGIKECTNKKGDSIKSLTHIKTELGKAITILESCGGEMTKQGFGQLIIPDVVNHACPDCGSDETNVAEIYCNNCFEYNCV